jgi:hypothetical protein
MARKKKYILESFYFTVDGSRCKKLFGITRHPCDLDPDHYSERDEICVVG